MVSAYQYKSVGFQLKLPVILCLLIGFSIAATIVYQNASRLLLKSAFSEQQSKLNAVAETVSGQFDAYVETTKILSSTFKNGYLAGFEVKKEMIDYAGQTIRNIDLYGLPLVNNTDLVDTFTQDTGAFVTLYSSTGTKWFSIASSFKSKNGKRDINHFLDTSFAGYAQLRQGKPYIAQVSVSGRSYLTYYDPVVDSDKKAGAIIMISLPVENATEEIFNSLKKIHWGESGETIIVDARPAQFGQYLLNSEDKTLKQQNMVMFTDTNGENPLVSLKGKQEGMIRFPVSVNGDTKEKYVVYKHIPGWNWFLLGGTWTKELTQGSNRLLLDIAAIFLFVGVVTYILVSLIIRRTLKPLKQLNGYMERLGSGEVSLTIDVSERASKNEMTRLTQDVGKMAAHLNKLVGQIRHSSSQVSAQSQNVAEDAGIALAQLTSQQQQIEQVVTAIEEMAASAESVSRQVESIAGNVRDANQNTQSGLAIVGSVATDISGLNEQLNHSYQAIQKVSKDSESIHAVIQMINDIAEQTNLLALNAAIEAARAGEQGRGFAVVADEVRVLANRTQLSVQNVVDIVSQLKESTQYAVSSTKLSQKQANKVLDESHDAGSALESIATQVNEIATQAEEITSIVEQQAQVSVQVSHHASEICSLNQQGRDISTKTSENARIMRQEADVLEEQVDFFH
ncbi:methyl-accepting chemotaxis protein [Vibrio salinus]|uniref:methyl-accepting chemotaxis protein n=1 Tax=Vibrio salinus TaxID=2899784 RepID=UPI001E31B844|nr:methyl-accepting chemotaxis protein [Vibrio salinus]MCE0496048.1 methyl-accepting chemotaxis protein [Vibrio salinus]